uniref:Uncharacterized protein n=1 Tax=Rhizophagus irregularis (strain DAOM 181602 / DAOM 197198 / MUCL 43194) TaxID=747089 RepID=U9UZI2_RHIID
MLIKSPNTRAYVIGLYYFCQTCLHCDTDCNYQTCKCSLDKLIQEQFKDQIVLKEDYNVAYK